MSTLDFQNPSVEVRQDLATLLMETVPRAMREIRRDMRVNRGPDLSVVHFRVLANIWREGKTNKDLAGEIGLSVAAMSRVVQCLTKKNYVTRQENPADRREFFICITPKGLSIFKEIRQKAKEKIDTQLRRLSAEEKKSLRNGLSMISKAMQLTKN